MTNQFARGLWVALVTPMDAEGEIDYEGLKQLVEMHVNAGTAGLVPCGTTGESATMTHDEHEKVIGTVIQAAAGRLEVMAGTGSNSTREAQKLTRFAKQEGATGALVITPYYNKPTQAGLDAHFRAVADAAPELPICLYNVPGRTGVDMSPETAANLANTVDSIVAIKEASGQVDRVTRLRALSSSLDVYSGDDGLTLAMLALGARGVISVVGNVLPAKMVAFVSSWYEGDVTAARAAHDKLFALMDSMFIETNPIPIKCLMAEQELLKPHFRLPLVPASEATMAKVRTLFAAVNK